MKLASIDVGLKRIGIAICLDDKTAIPQDAIIRKNRKQASNDLKNFITDWEIEKLIVGIPMEGSSTDEMKRRITHFVNLLELSIPVVYQDEQNSSQEAKEMSAGIFKHSRDGKIDSLAATIILKRYLSGVKTN